MLDTIQDQNHKKAQDVSARYRKTETELIEILEQVDQHKVYLRYGHSSLYQYVVKELKLSESVAYNFITVMRKVREVPALKHKMEIGEITLTNARQIAPVLNFSNQEEWLHKAAEFSKRRLEKEIVKIRPEVATPERTKYVTESRVKLELGLPEDKMMKLRRAQDLLSQATSQSASLEDTLIAMTEFYLKHKDPVKKARRVIVKKGFAQKTTRSGILTEKMLPKKILTDQGQPVPGQVKNLHLVNLQAPDVVNNKLIPRVVLREVIPSSILHQVNLRDQRKCRYINQKGERCSQSRWVEIHHKIPVSQGGQNTVANLITLCTVHHDWIHAG